MSGYKQEYLAIKYDYDTKCSLSDERLNSLIRLLDTKVRAYETSTNDTRPKFCFDKRGVIIGTDGKPSADGTRLQYYSEKECASMPNGIHQGNGECTISTGGSYSWNCRPTSNVASGSGSTSAAMEDLSGAFLPISQYYANLVSIKKRLTKFLENASTEVNHSQDGLINEERYHNRAAPQDAVKPRELVFGLFSELRPSSLPIIIAAGVFMASLAILMIFQMYGFTGQINLPPALVSRYTALTSATLEDTVYRNPMVLGGGGILVGVAVAVLSFIYLRPKQN